MPCPVEVGTEAELPVPAAQKCQRPSTTYMERLQPELTPDMRTVLIDWMVEVAQVQPAQCACPCAHAPALSGLTTHMSRAL